MQTINITKLAQAVAATLNEYKAVVYDDMVDAIEETSKACVDEIKSAALGYGWKDYAKTWTRTKQPSASPTGYDVVVHAKSGGYQIAHLLERSHAKRGGGRSRAFPHIAPAETHADERLTRLLRQKIGGG